MNQRVFRRGWPVDPVVSTDCPSGPAEILKNGEFGVLVPVGDLSKNSIIETLGSKQIPSSHFKDQKGKIVKAQYRKLTPVGDYQAMARVMIETLENPPDSEKLKERGAEFTAAASAGRYLGLVEQKAKKQ